MRNCGAEVKASFRLGVLCANCGAVSGRRLDVPAVDDAPCDVDELLESEFLRQQRFVCPTCESFIATVRSVAPWPQPKEHSHE